MTISKYKCKYCSTDLPSNIVKTYNFNVCPSCGRLYPKCAEYIKQYFRIIQLSVSLEKAADLILKNEMTAAVREAIVTLETTVRKVSGLENQSGADLMAKAFSFKIDQQTKKVIEGPRVQINDLSSIFKRNEQDGVRFVAMGLMQGVRNIFMHSKGTEKLFYCLQVISTADMILKQIAGFGAIAE